MLKTIFLRNVYKVHCNKRNPMHLQIFRTYADDDSSKKPTNAQDRLNELLKSMVEQKLTEKTGDVKLAKPIPRRKSKIEPEKERPKSFEQQVTTAAKTVAEQIGGDAKQTESELLSKLLNPIKDENTKGTDSLSDIVKGMKIDRGSKAPEEVSRAQQVRQLIAMNKDIQGGKPINDRKMQRKVQSKQEKIVPEKVDLFGEKPLGIFTENPNPAAEDGQRNKTWNELYQRELRLAVTHPPTNYFQQMILWTNQGKVWKFPIDNEQGMEEEKNIYFTEHVFLEKHLEPWCPTRGPVRHFMELVCVGLSKNPYMSVETKKGHIEWYRNYFEEKRSTLMEVGALPDVEVADKQIK